MTAKEKQTVTDLEKLTKEVKTLRAQIKDLNTELHDFNKWRKAIEDKIGAVSYEA